MATKDKKEGTSLSDYAKAIDYAGKRREAERRKFNDELPEPDIFIPDEEDPKMGIGWWVRPDGWAVAYRRYHNGYQMFPCDQVNKELIDSLHAIFKKKIKG